MPKVGAYFLYMMDYKRDQEKTLGRTLSMPEVSQMASDSWNMMTEDEKAIYKEKAKNGDRFSRRNVGGDGGGNGGGAGGCSTNSGRFTSQGVPVTVYEQEERKKKNDDENMRRRIGLMIQRIPLFTDFLSHPLYFMYGNYFYKNNDGKYAPAELAMIKFTFRDGVLKKFHTFINPGRSELGYAYTVKAHSESTHVLPTPPNAYGETNLGRVLYEIQKFMKDDSVGFDGGNPMVFTYVDPFASEESQIDVLNSFLKQFGGDVPVKIDIYPMTRLFYALRKELASRGRCDDIPNENFTNVFLSRDPYETMGGISCQYHEDRDATRHCALSRVRRWTFLMADHFCEHLGVELIPGTHLPKNSAVPRSMSSLASGLESDNESVSSNMKRDNDSESDTKSLRGPGSHAFSDAKSEEGQPIMPLRERAHRASVLTLNSEIQSIRTSSTAASGGGSGHGRMRPSRSSILAGAGHGQGRANSSTFYNP